MLFATLFVVVGLAAALPGGGIQTPGKNDEFGLIAIHSGSPIQNTGVTAGHSHLLIGGKQDAACDSPSRFATFHLKDGGALLYSHSGKPQQLYVNRSGMGQGATGYTTGAQSTPKNAERKGFSINKKGNLVFDGLSPKACPTGLKTGGYSIWFSNLEQPGHNKGCIGVSLRAIKSSHPVSCHYST